jgi:hypothetical protein
VMVVTTPSQHTPIKFTTKGNFAVDQIITP